MKAKKYSARRSLQDAAWRWANTRAEALKKLNIKMLPIDLKAAFIAGVAFEKARERRERKWATDERNPMNWR